MTLQEVTMYRLVCDFPSCEKSPQDGGEYYAWGNDAAAIDEATDGDWWEGRDGKSYYCNNHPTEWASDHEDGEPYPAPPYLLIHDGDLPTTADDGKVTLIEAAA